MRFFIKLKFLFYKFEIIILIWEIQYRIIIIINQIFDDSIVWIYNFQFALIFLFILKLFLLCIKIWYSPDLININYTFILHKMYLIFFIIINLKVLIFLNIFIYILQIYFILFIFLLSILIWIFLWFFFIKIIFFYFFN